MPPRRLRMSLPERGAVIYPKACPKCAGDVEWQEDMYGKRLSCLQCGWEFDGVVKDHQIDPGLAKHS